MKCQSRHHALLAKKWGGGGGLQPHPAPPAPACLENSDKLTILVLMKLELATILILFLNFINYGPQYSYRLNSYKVFFLI